MRSSAERQRERERPDAGRATRGSWASGTGLAATGLGGIGFVASGVLPLESVTRSLARELGNGWHR